MNPFQQFLQSAVGKGLQRVPGVIDNLGAPIQRSIGSIRDNFVNKLSSRPTAFPFNDPLTFLKGQAGYAQRQIQGGIGQGIGQVGNLYKKLPTAINPFATRTPTTLLGKAGSLVNPFNPVNVASFAGAAVLNAAIPDNTKRDNEFYNLGLLTLAPGIPGKMAALGLLGTTSLGLSEKEETRLSQRGKNYIVKGVEYDYFTGRAVKRPDNVIVNDPQNRLMAPPVDSGFIEIDNNTNNRRFGNASPRNTEAERRSYLSELSSVAQQTAQNPLLNQYNALRKPDPRAAEDLGMQMFALANPELAKKVPPSQAGYDVMQRVYPQATTTATLPTSVDSTELTEEEIAIAMAKQMLYNQYNQY